MNYDEIEIECLRILARIGVEATISTTVLTTIECADVKNAAAL